MALAAKRVAEHLAGITRADFLSNRTVQAAVEREISILGEAAGRISQAYRNVHTEVPWARVIHLRNFYTHAYDLLDPRETWITARRFVPRVERLVAALVPPPVDNVDGESEGIEPSTNQEN